MEKGVLVLNTVASFLETGIGIWIFSKVFPKRKEYGTKQGIASVILYSLIATIFCSQFMPNALITVKICICIVPVLLWIIHIRVCKEKNSNLLQESKCITDVVLFSLVMGINAYNAQIGYISNITTLIGGLFPFIFLYIVYECSVFQAYLWELLYLSHIGILKLAYLTYESQRRGLIWINDSRLNTYGSILFKFAISVFVVLLVKCFAIDRLLKQLLNKRKCFALITGLGILSFTFAFMDMRRVGLARSFGVNELTAILAVVVCLVIGLVFAFSYAFAKIEQTEKCILEVRNQAIEQQYQELHNAYEQNRCFVHDQKHMVQFLAECLSMGNIQEAEQFLKNYKNSVLQGSHHSWTGISTLDFIINMKNRRMKELGIKFELVASIDEIAIDNADFVVLMGNLFDNAIEASEKCVEESRNIKLTLRTVNRMFLIQMENSNAEIPQKKSNQFLTTKKDIENHGWGVASVEHLVKKYDGSIKFSYDSKKFKVSIIL